MKNTITQPKIVLALDDSLSFRKLQKVVNNSEVDILELRVDNFSSQNLVYLHSAFKKYQTLNIPILLTIRSSKEGSNTKINAKTRFELFKELMSYATCIDIELSSHSFIDKLISLAKSNHQGVIISYHNFKSTPPIKQLEKIISQAKQKKADLIKIALMAKNTRDVKKLAKLTLNHEKLITISMGEYGKISRILFPALGSSLIYTFIGTPTAPGQFSLKEINRLKKELY